MKQYCKLKGFAHAFEVDTRGWIVEAESKLSGRIILVVAQQGGLMSTFRFVRGHGVFQDPDFYVLDGHGGGVYVPQRSIETARVVTAEISQVLRCFLSDELLAGVEILICVTPDPQEVGGEFSLFTGPFPPQFRKSKRTRDR